MDASIRTTVAAIVAESWVLHTALAMMKGRIVVVVVDKALIHGHGIERRVAKLLLLLSSMLLLLQRKTTISIHCPGVIHRVHAIRSVVEASKGPACINMHESSITL